MIKIAVVLSALARSNSWSAEFKLELGDYMLASSCFKTGLAAFKRAFEDYKIVPSRCKLARCQLNLAAD
jgi:hypothetical protein